MENWRKHIKAMVAWLTCLVGNYFLRFTVFAAAVGGTTGTAEDDEFDRVQLDMSALEEVTANQPKQNLTDFTSSASETASQYWSYFKFAAIVIGIIAAIVLVVFVARRIKSKKIQLKSATKGYNIAKGVASVVLAGVIVAINVATSIYANTLDAVLTNYGSTDVETSGNQWIQLAKDIANEGIVLMQNNNNALPLEKNTKVNLLGYYAYNSFYNGSGSGSLASTNASNLTTALTEAGFEVNPATESLYAQPEDDGSKNLGFENMSGYSIDEVPMDKYTGDTSFESLKEYSDTAIVVIGRAGSEGTDLTEFEGEEGKEYLELSDTEEELLKNACDTFEKVIVVYNGGNTLELGFLDEYDIDAFLWCEQPGEYGFSSLASVLDGDVNPSGSLVDTWVYDNHSAPSSENFANQRADNGASFYADYVEGIYVGYKWYETAYAEKAVVTDTKTGVTYDYKNYDDIVKYPFGYGLSYTTFDEKIKSGLGDNVKLDPEGKLEVQVEVTNTGDVAGKDTVELYMTAPYTEYDMENGIEKAAVSLCGYEKTEELEPGESEVVTITVNAEDIASYDSSFENEDGKKGAYMLDAGEYVFSVRSDAHTVIEEGTAVLDTDYFYSGENKRSSDNQQAYNQFDDASRGIYLSRKDGFANYTEAMESVSTSVEDTSFDDDPAAYDEEYDNAVTETYEEGVDYGVKGDLTLKDMRGLDFDDEKWNQLISQLSLEDLQKLVGGGLSGLGGIDSIDMAVMSNAEGPSGLTSMYSGLHVVAYPAPVTLAATYNKDLAHQYGLMIADQAHELGITSWNGPAMNIHRYAYAGRNFEYFSEDSLVSALTAGNIVRGASDRGLVVYMKHFALNEMESHRSDHLHTYANEQTIREIYLKPFETCVKYGEAKGIMTSMNYIGDIYVSASKELVTEVLRNEWGFKGHVMTDMAQGNYALKSADSCVRAGTDTWLAIQAPTLSVETDADIYYMQRAAKHILYTFANATTIDAEVYPWRTLVGVISVELGVMLVLSVAEMVLRNRKKKEQVSVE